MRRRSRSARDIGSPAVADCPRAAFRWSRAMDEPTDVAKRVRAAREETRRPSLERPGNWRLRTSSMFASGWLCSSTRPASSRTGSWPTRWRTTCPPTAWSPDEGWSRTGPPDRCERSQRQGWIVGLVRSRRSSGSPRWLCETSSAVLVRRFRRSPNHRSGRSISRPTGCRPDLRNQVALSGKVPQICCLFGPSAAGGAYIPSFCDVVIMVEGNASMYLGSPRMAEMVVGEKVTLEDMRRAHARHCLRVW